MLSRIDEIIYPNRCEVIEFSDPQRFVYPIFKNGSSSLYEHARSQNYKIILNAQIKKITEINIVLRDPMERFISGFNEFVFYTKREKSELDVDTIIYFAETYLFLDRHYAPQLSWLINLNKYLNTEAVIHLHSMEALSTFTPLHSLSKEKNILSQEVIDRLKTNSHNEMYIRLDNLLLELVGQKLTFKEILLYINKQDPVAYSKLSCVALD